MKQFTEINPNLSYRISLVKGTQFLCITDAIEYEKKDQSTQRIAEN